jgi:hypothetical protein
MMMTTTSFPQKVAPFSESQLVFSHDEGQPGVEIALDAGGDHQFNLGHLRREGAGRLIRLLLQTAGYRRAVRWRVRVEKKFGCGAETRPVTVVSSKPWCCYLKIKPGDNNTAHFCSLIMPDGFRGEAVYEDLKEVEMRVNAAWRRGFEGEVAPVEEQDQTDNVEAEQPPAPEPAPAELPSEPPPDAPPAEAAEAPAEQATESTTSEPSELLGFSADPDKVRLTLLAIHEVGEETKAGTLDEFVGALTPKMGWQGLRRKQIGGLFTALVRRGLIQKVSRGSQPVAYALTDEGRKLIEDLLPASQAHAPSRSAASIVAGMGLSASGAPSVRELSGLVERLNSNVKRLTELQARRAQLVSELETIDAEIRELNRHVNNPEVQELIRRLLLATGQGS